MCFYLTENVCADDIFGADHASQKLSINSVSLTITKFEFL